MHPRQARKAWSAETRRKAADVLDFVRRAARCIRARSISTSRMGA